jgi:hypothetical protein
VASCSSGADGNITHVRGGVGRRIGHVLSQRLVAAGEMVRNVPATLALWC